MDDHKCPWCGEDLDPDNFDDELQEHVAECDVYLTEQNMWSNL